MLREKAYQKPRRSIANAALSAVLCAIALGFWGRGSTTARASTPGDDYSTISYKNGDLKIEAYFYKPEGEGPFPLVIYNHGSRQGQERHEVPFSYVADVLKAHGYAVLVPERRGYGKSDGQTFGEEVGSDVADKMMHRFHEEASDILAGLDHARQFPSVDPGKVVIMGWSHGGVVSLLAASERHEFIGLIDQAGGALTWNRSPTLRRELLAAARKINIPALCMDAQNDATTDAVKEVSAAIRSRAMPVKTIIYPPFTPNGNPHNIAPGHLIFSLQGISIWQDDMLSFVRALTLNHRASGASTLCSGRTHPACPEPDHKDNSNVAELRNGGWPSGLPLR